VTFAYVMNKVVPSLIVPTTEALLKRLYDIMRT
jgi:hypothetical protein